MSEPEDETECGRWHYEAPFLLSVETQEKKRIYSFAVMAKEQFQIIVVLPYADGEQKVSVNGNATRPHVLKNALTFVNQNELEFQTAWYHSQSKNNVKGERKISSDIFL